MSSSRRNLLLAALFTSALTVPLWAEKPADSGSRKDSQYSPEGVSKPKIPREIGGKSYKEWKADIDSQDPSVRSEAIAVIPFFLEGAQDAVTVILRHIHDQDASVRAKAVLALQIMSISGPDRIRVVKAMGDLIANDRQAIIRYEAARALRRFTSVEVHEVLGDLVKGVGDTSTFELREACIVDIILAGVDPKKGPDMRVTDALMLRTKPINEPTTKVRLEAIIALGALGRPQDPNKLRQVYGALQDHFHSNNHAIQMWAHVSKMALEDKVDKTYLNLIATKFLKDPERTTRVQAVTALGALQDKADAYLPNMLEMMRYEKDTPVLSAGCSALGRMKNKGPRVLRELIRQTERNKDEEKQIVVAACNALAEIGAPTPEVMEALQTVAERPDLDAQSKAAVKRAIETIQKPKADDDTAPRKTTRQK